ncbi:ABC transporter permease [Aerococcus urinaeequi]|uniref:ABC transporter permease n=1 Tax=Aerococcus urinaeequi TaxID=51665 RepID=UPI003D6A7996
MKKKNNQNSVALLGIFLLTLWEIAGRLNWLPVYVIPSPSEFGLVLISDWKPLTYNSLFTLTQAIIGLSIGSTLGFLLAVFMDRFKWIRETIYPYLIVIQTIPTVAIAPVLVLVLGYGMLPKIVLVTITSLFPIVINLLEGFTSVDRDSIDLLELMGANYSQILWHVKLPTSLSYFFSGLKISVTYAFVGSVIAEWLGGFEGLGVYMIHAKQAFAYDKMFAAIVVISMVSLLLMGLVTLIERKTVSWKYHDYKIKDEK